MVVNSPVEAMEETKNNPAPNTGELKALISLIDDPDEHIYEHVRSRLLEIGEPVIPELESSWELFDFGDRFQERIENIIHEIQFERLKARLQAWKEMGAKHVLDGALLIARYQYPDLDEIEVRNKLLKMRQEIWLEVNRKSTSMEMVRAINHTLFEVHGFRGNKQNYHAPQNSFINNVLETKKGNPLSLSIIYLALAESLDIPIKGVNLPSHFVLGYVDPGSTIRFEALPDGTTVILPSESFEIAFYINTFSQGAILHRGDITTFLDNLKIEHKPEFFEPCSNVEIIRRLITNPIYSYHKLGYTEKVEELRQLSAVLTGSLSGNDNEML